MSLLLRQVFVIKLVKDQELGRSVILLLSDDVRDREVRAHVRE